MCRSNAPCIVADATQWFADPSCWIYQTLASTLLNFLPELVSWRNRALRDAGSHNTQGETSRIQDAPAVLLTDTVGFIQKLLTYLIVFRDIEEVKEADVLIRC
jgi:50S ribosomal subunit-associated GTPase HflX